MMVTNDLFKKETNLMAVMTMMMMMKNSIETEGCNHDLNGFLQLIVGPALNIHYTLYRREDVQ